MGRVPDIKRIRAEDFPEEMQDTVSKLAYPINTFFDQLIALLTNNIDFQNLSQQVSEFTIETDSLGDPVNPPKINVNLGGRKVIGIFCISVTNLDDAASYPTSQPYVGFNVISNTLVAITAIKGLGASGRYRLRVLLVT